MKEKIQNISSLNDGVENTYKIDGLMDDECIEKEKSEFERAADRMEILTMKRKRLQYDLKGVEEEIKSVSEIINIICI